MYAMDMTRPLKVGIAPRVSGSGGGHYTTTPQSRSASFGWLVVGWLVVGCRHGNWPRIRGFPLENKSPPKKMKRSAQIRMQWFYSKLKTGKTGRCKAVLCSFYVLSLLKSFTFSFRGIRLLTPTGGVPPWTPTGGLLRPPGTYFSADFSILNSHACG